MVGSSLLIIRCLFLTIVHCLNHKNLYKYFDLGRMKMKMGLEKACTLFFFKLSFQVDFKNLNMLNAIGIPS